MRSPKFVLLASVAGLLAWSTADRAAVGQSVLPSPAVGASSDGDQDDDSDTGGRAGVHHFSNDSGRLRTFSTLGELDKNNPFFKSIGTNGRTCNSCHLEKNGWGISRDSIRDLFSKTGGTDPIFRTVDGSNTPTADVSTVAKRRDAYSMLLSRGVIRIGIPMPTTSEFDLIAVDDPYHFASANELSLFRRPPPVANLRFQATIMIDGRETFPGLTIPQDLAHQANGATTGHAQSARDLTAAEQQQIVDFELSLFSAQIRDNKAGKLNVKGALGGPEPLVTEPFYIGINDPFPNGDPTGKVFDPRVFRNFDAWVTFQGAQHGKDAERAAINRGQELFNTKLIKLSGVKGINDELGVPVFMGSCTTCHDTPNNGNHSKSGPVDLGITTEARRKPDEPLYTFRNKATGEIVKTTDPGRGLITGLWKHIGRMKAPSLHSLAARAPYFHNGSADSLLDVVNFYDERFAIGLTEKEKKDMVAFLRSL